MKKISLLLTAAAWVSAAYATPVPKILIVAGTDSFASTVATRLNTELSGSNAVTVVTTGVPADLITPGYAQIYDVRYSNAPVFSAGEQTQYLAFLNASPGHALFLMGENAGFAARDNAIFSFIAAAGGGTVPPVTATSIATQTVVPPFTGPNAITSIKYAACGLMSSSGTGVFVSRETGGGCALYFGIGTLANATPGALVVVTDVNFIGSAPNSGALNEDSFRQNLEALVASPTTPPHITSLSPPGGPLSGGTAVTITGTNFTGATDVSFGGITATFTVTDSTHIAAITPAQTAGTATVLVTTPDGQSSGDVQFTYGASSSSSLSLSLYPQTLSVTYQLGTAFTGATQTLYVSELGTASAANWSASASPAVSWLNLSAATGSSLTPETLTFNPAGLAAGVYTTNITFTIPDLGLSVAPVTVPVTFTILAPAAISVNPTAVSVLASQGQTTPIIVPITLGTPGISWTLQQGLPAQPWLSIDNTTGTAATAVNLTVDPTKLAGGTYFASILVTSPGAPNSPLTIPVKLTVGTGLLSVAPLVNGASFAPSAGNQVAPNELISLFLPGISCASTPTVSMSGATAQVLAFASGQLNLVLPESITQGPLTVNCSGSPQWSFYGLAVAQSVPGLFTAGQNGIGPAAVVNQDGTANSASNAAAKGSIVAVYGTGFGAYDPVSTDGLRRLSGAVTATIGGLPASVTYAGTLPGSALSVSQLNVEVPTGAGSGPAIPIVLTVNGATTQSGVTLAVK